MIRLLSYIAIIFTFTAFSQQNLLPLQSFYKDQLYANKLDNPYNGGSFLPVASYEYDLIPAIIDSSKQYYDFTETLFKKYLFEIEGDDYSIRITPMIDFAAGRDLSDTTSPKLFQNTRGFYVEGTLLDKFSFSTSFYENQGRYAKYQTDYYKMFGEFYPSGSKYNQQNAVIPGSARTKPFKGDGFDYAYAIGSLCYHPLPKLRITAGNNQQFVGAGHRSILLSDNSIPVPYYRVDLSIVDKLSFTYMRARLMNLLRRPYTSAAEAYYEAKGYSVNYLTYKPTKNINISLFDGALWNRGDSLIGRSSHPLNYNPIPLLSALVLSETDECSALTGLNFEAQIGQKHKVYGQVAINDLKTEKFAFQLGYRGYRFFNINDLMLQLEFNSIPSGFYLNTNPRLNYVNFNLPLAHVKGDGFNEIVFRGSYEWKRLYFDETFVYYSLMDYDPKALLPYYHSFDRQNYSIVYSNTEVGYRFNRKINLCLFGSVIIRSQTGFEDSSTSLFQIGLRTSFINHYTDF